MGASGSPTDTAEVDYATCSSEDLMDGVERLAAVERVGRRQLCDMVSVMDGREAWKIDGATSMEGWLAARLVTTYGHAAEIVRVARALRRLPAIGAAFGDGALSWDQLLPLIRFATPESDAILAEEAPGMSIAQLERMARAAKANSRRKAREIDGRRFLHIRQSKLEGWARGSFLLPADQAAVCETALERLASAHDAPADPELTDPFDARMADALVELCSGSLAADTDTDRSTVVLHVDIDLLAGLPGIAELAGGVAVDEDVVRRLMCDCRYQLVVDRPDGTTLFATDVRRSAPPWMNRLLRRRDGHCRFPGCRRRRWLQAHHLFIEWHHGGPTEPWNLVMLCGRHHRLVHDGGWTVTGRTDGELVFTSPFGRRLTSRPATIPAAVRQRLFADPADPAADPEPDPPPGGPTVADAPPPPGHPPEPPPDDDVERLIATLRHLALRFPELSRLAGATT